MFGPYYLRQGLHKKPFEHAIALLRDLVEHPAPSLPDFRVKGDVDQYDRLLDG